MRRPTWCVVTLIERIIDSSEKWRIPFPTRHTRLTTIGNSQITYMTFFPHILCVRFIDKTTTRTKYRSRVYQLETFKTTSIAISLFTGARDLCKESLAFGHTRGNESVTRLVYFLTQKRFFGGVNTQTSEENRAENDAITAGNATRSLSF